MNSFADIIAAISTPPGKGGVAIIRISGEGSAALAEKIFLPASGKSFGEYSPRMQVYGYIMTQDGKKLDDVMACRFASGASYTGEETVEITSHGGILISSMVLERVLSEGARTAEAGEFTRRAFINGRLSLTDAEYIGALLEAKSREQVKLASEESRSALKARTKEISDALTEILSSVYARIDYPDEDLGDFTDEQILDSLTVCNEKIKALLATYRTGKAVLEGIKTVICGKPNVGKSTLYNAILGEDAAIVTDIKGTTTDVLEKSVSLGRVILRLFDTAGIRSASDAGAIEKIGIEKTRGALNSAELVLAVFDLSDDFSDEDEDVIRAVEHLSAVKIALLNKSDSPKHLNAEKIYEKFDTVLTISAKSRENSRQALSEIINKMFTDEKIVLGESAVIAEARQNAVLTSAQEFISLASDAIKCGASSDMVSSDIERALRAISEADGREVSESVTNDIFSRFCVGK